MIIVTRPSPKGEELTQWLREANLLAQHVPLFTIKAGSDLFRLPLLLKQLQPEDYVIIVSPQVAHMIESNQIELNAPSHIRYFAIGKETAGLFSQLSGRHTDHPKDENSEGLLALLSKHDLKNKTILILKGNAGRKILAKTLKNQQANCHFVECYQRTPICYDKMQFLHDLTDSVIIVTSVDSLLQLELYQIAQHKLTSCLLVASPRIENMAKLLGWKTILCCDSANNKNLLKTLVSLCNNKAHMA